ncbi:hypothetical protein A176_002682 [Myxococcus hansupus]|uniref:Uncharacterized protein n=1 Tax=Pseudomyxococcus hansupus TaxID=1297742 RepID=A0A0H4WWP4_9BACT|nr:hypothetical protein A176_002682 [Myxococcus hansupus]
MREPHLQPLRLAGGLSHLGEREPVGSRHGSRAFYGLDGGRSSGSH